MTERNPQNPTTSPETARPTTISTPDAPAEGYDANGAPVAAREAEPDCQPGWMLRQENAALRAQLSVAAERAERLSGMVKWRAGHIDRLAAELAETKRNLDSAVELSTERLNRAVLAERELEQVKRERDGFKADAVRIAKEGRERFEVAEDERDAARAEAGEWQQQAEEQRQRAARNEVEAVNLRRRLSEAEATVARMREALAEAREHLARIGWSLTGGTNPREPTKPAECGICGAGPTETCAHGPAPKPAPDREPESRHHITTDAHGVKHYTFPAHIGPSGAVWKTPRPDSDREPTTAEPAKCFGPVPGVDCLVNPDGKHIPFGGGICRHATTPGGEG